MDFANKTYALVMDMVWPGHELWRRSEKGKGDVIEAMLGWGFLMRKMSRATLEDMLGWAPLTDDAERICRHLEIVIFFVYTHYEFYSAHYAADRNVSSNHS